MKTTATKVLFWRTPDVFSNWHPSPFVLEGVPYRNAEQYLMAEKARLFGDEAVVASILKSTNPNEMRTLGRAVKGYSDALWVPVREEVMLKGSVAKFEQNPLMGAQLQATEALELVEASPVDRIWGIGLSEDDLRADDKAKWRGLNLLGIALMRTRTLLG